MDEFIDPEDLPFTEEEVFRAGCLFLPPEASRAMAQHLAECGPEMIALRQKKRADMFASGIRDAYRQVFDGVGYPRDLLPALASMSNDAESRATLQMEWRWNATYRATIERLRFDSLVEQGLVPSYEEMRRRERESSKRKGARERHEQGLVVQLPPPAPPTTAMLRAAHAAVAKERAEWAARVARFRTSSASSE